LGGLLALQLFHRSREAARVDQDGVLVPLARQDRERWDRVRIAQGFRVLSLALAHRALGPWLVQALIAAEHAGDAPDWERIVRLYDLLLAMMPGPVVALNRAVAVGEATGPAVGLAEVEQITGLTNYHLFHAARAHLLERVGRREEALAAWCSAAALTTNLSESAFAASHINRLRAQVRDDGPGASGPRF
jgi:RNA polymerase sigma-70 factor (ECF subfamily)